MPDTRSAAVCLDSLERSGGWQAQTMLKRLLRQGGVKGYSMLVCCQGSFKAPLRGPFGGTDAPGSTPDSPNFLARLL